MFYLVFAQNRLGTLRNKDRRCCHHIIPISRRGTQFWIVLDLGLSPTGPHGGHAPISKGEGDHLAAFASRENLKKPHIKTYHWHFRSSAENSRNLPVERNKRQGQDWISVATTSLYVVHSRPRPFPDGMRDGTLSSSTGNQAIMEHCFQNGAPIKDQYSVRHFQTSVPPKIHLFILFWEATRGGDLGK